MIPAIKKQLLANWPSAELGQKPDDLLFIKFIDRGIRAAEVGIVSFLVKGIYAGQERPLMILRFARYPNNSDANLSLRKERENLAIIQEKLAGQPLAITIPKVSWREYIAGAHILGISLLPGVELSRSILAEDMLKRYIENYSLVLGWLVGFQGAMGIAATKSAGEIAKELIVEYNQLFPDEADMKGYFTRLLNLAAQYDGIEVAVFPQQGDYHAENIFLMNREVSGVIDWEDFEPLGVPGFDIIHFIKTYFEALLAYFTGRGQVAQIEKLSSDAGTSALIRANLESYFQLMQIDPAIFQFLVPFYLIKSACLAGCPRKKALGALRKIKIILQLQPFTLEDLFLYMSVFNYGDLYTRASRENNQQLADLCKSKISKIQESAKLKRIG